MVDRLLQEELAKVSASGPNFCDAAPKIGANFVDDPSVVAASKLHRFQVFAEV
jgi:hypothetical protein